MKPKIINFYAGPSAGKSTSTALTAAPLSNCKKICAICFEEK